MHLVGYLYEDYHDARSTDRKVCNVSLFFLYFCLHYFLHFLIS